MKHSPFVSGLRFLPFAFLAVMVGILGCAWLALGQRPAPKPPLSGTNPEAVKAEQSRIEYEQDALEKRVAMLQTQLGWVLAAVALFTLVQGAFAALGAYNFVQQADRIMADITRRGDRAVKDIEKLALEVRARYPMFQRVEDARREALESLHHVLENADWRDDIYNRLETQKRQRLLSVENFLGLEFLESGSGIAGDLRVMGYFYASKYLNEKRKNPTDLDRAQYYLYLALDSSNHAFYHLNDYGLLHLEIMRPSRLDDAERWFKESRRKRKEHQRAAYNLAAIALKRGNLAANEPDKVRHYREAQDLLREALGYSFWELAKNIEKEGDIHYNLACCLARLSGCRGIENAPSLLTEALKELEAAATIGGTKPEVLSGDLNKDAGDLIALSRSTDETIRTELSRIRSLFDQVWAKMGVPRT